ncbi:hypothetical protein ULG90_11665 [Halopseudomonas pachastrellae]|nr:hypothetical protein ULG90_11665 [Halopseudomonas pachastrellae]
METRANHVLIGLFTVLAALASIIFAIWLSSASTSSEQNSYTVVFKQAVTGLSRGSAGAVQRYPYWRDHRTESGSR